MKKIDNGMWIVENPTPYGTRIEVFNTQEEAEAFVYSQKPLIKFLRQLKNIFK